MRRAAFPLWRFSLRVYRSPGIAQVCLALQDGCAADVNVLLFCCWMGRNGRRLSRRALRSAMRAVGPWQHDVVQPLRRARRALRIASRRFELERSRALRRRIGAAELEAEYLEQRVLARCAAELPPLARKVEPRAATQANLSDYLDLLGASPGPREARDLATLIDACFPRPSSAPGR